VNNLQGTNWLAPFGKDYIEFSFREARKADPSAKLFYNDFALEYGGPKWEAVLSLVKDLKSKGLIDGVGFQGHLGLSWGLPDPAVLASQFRQLRNLGLEVRITEFDVVIAGAAGSEQERLAMQAQAYKDFLNVCLAAPNCKAFHMWGFSDKHSWMTDGDNGGDGPDNAPLIYDANYQPKPAYYALKDALLGR
jgi:endo-1,4-beta-xylanase